MPRDEINARDAHGATPLMRAASVGHIDVCTVLLEVGADPDILDNQGRSVLDYSTDAIKPRLQAIIGALKQTSGHGARASR